MILREKYHCTHNVHNIFQELLPDLLSGYVDHLQRGKLSNKFAEEDDENVDFGGSSGTVEDTCVKVWNHS